MNDTEGLKLEGSITEEEGRQIALLMRQHSLWITEQLERSLIVGHHLGFLLAKRLMKEKDVPRFAVDVLTGYSTVRHLHFARRMNYYKRGGLHLEMIADWTPPGWVCSLFPMPAPDMEVVTLEYVVDALHGEADLCTEWDSVPLGRVLHVAHMLVSHQEADGLWPAVLNLRTGYGVGDRRSSAPRNLMRRLNMILRSTEFDWAIQRIEENEKHIKAGIHAQNVK